MNTVTVAGMSREECALLMTLSTIESLKNKGIVEGGYLRILPEGEATCDELRKAGFEFNEGELESAFAYLTDAGDVLAPEQENEQ